MIVFKRITLFFILSFLLLILIKLTIVFTVKNTDLILFKNADFVKAALVVKNYNIGNYDNSIKYGNLIKNKSYKNYHNLGNSYFKKYKLDLDLKNLNYAILNYNMSLSKKYTEFTNHNLQLALNELNNYLNQNDISNGDNINSDIGIDSDAKKYILDKNLETMSGSKLEKFNKIVDEL